MTTWAATPQLDNSTWKDIRSFVLVTQSPSSQMHTVIALTVLEPGLYYAPFGTEVFDK